MLLASFCMFLSCTESDRDEDDSALNPGVGEQLSLSFTLPLKSAGATKATESDSEVGEKLVDGVRIVLYGPEITPSIRYSWDCDIRIDYDSDISGFVASGSDLQWYSNGGSSQTMTIQTKAKKLTQDNYRMLIIVNPNEKIKELTDKETGLGLDELERVTFDPTEENSLYRTWDNGTDEVPAYFLMLNTQGPTEVVKGNFWPTEERAELHPVSGNVERAAAKIVCSHQGPSTRSTLEAGNGRFVMHLGYDISGDYDLPDWVEDCIYNCGGTYDRATKICNVCNIKYGFSLGNYTDIPRYIVATDLLWQVDIINKKSYWYRHLANKKGNTTKEKPGDTDTENFYAVDPNFSGFSGTDKVNDEFIYKKDIKYTNGKGESYRKLGPADYVYSSYWSWTKEQADGSTIYVPENTMAPGEQNADVMTRVLVKAILRREQVGLPEGTPPDSPANIGDFFLFKGGVQGNSTYNMNNQYGEGDGAKYFYLIPVDYLVKYKNDPALIPVNLTNGDISLSQAIDQFSDDNPGFKWDDISSNDEPLLSDYLIFYKNGEMYYEIPIKHFPGVSEGGYGRYGIVRNRAYQLDLLDIMSLGAPTIPSVSKE